MHKLGNWKSICDQARQQWCSQHPCVKTRNREKTPSALCFSFDQLLPTAPVFSRLKYACPACCNQQMFVSFNCTFLLSFFFEGTGGRFAVCRLLLQLCFPADDLLVRKARQWREELKGDLAYSLSPCSLDRIPWFFFHPSGHLCLQSECGWTVHGPEMFLLQMALEI